MVLVGRAGPPQLVEVARERSGGVDQDVARVDQGVECAEDLGLGGAGVLVGGGVGGVDPLLPPPFGRGPPPRVPSAVAQGLREGGQALAGVGDERQRGLLVGVEAGDVEVEEAGAPGEEGAGGGGEVGVAGADADDEVGGTGQGGGGLRAGVADTAHVAGVVVRQGTLAGLGGGDGQTGALGEGPQGLLGSAVPHAAARDDQGPLGGPHRPYGRVEFGRVGAGAADAPGPLGEELLGPVVRLRLHVLGQGEGHGAGRGGVGEDPGGFEGGRDQGLGAADPVEVHRDGPQAVVDGHVARGRELELLEDGVGGPGREGVAGEEQDGQAVDGGEGGAGDEVGGAGADGGGDGVRGEAVRLAGVADGGVDHGLFVAALVEGHERAVLNERLPGPGDVPVPEDPPGGGDQAAALAVALGVLGGEEADEGLGGGEPDGAHAGLLASCGAGRAVLTRTPPRTPGGSGSSTRVRYRGPPSR